MKPLFDRVIITPDPAEHKTAGGIILPGSAQEKPPMGTVKFIGPGKDGVPLAVKPGDRVLYARHAGTEIEYDGEIVLIMRESDILSII